MSSTRVRVGSVVEWGIAAACIAAAFGLVAVALQEVRTFSTIPPVIAEERAPIDTPASVPSGAAAVPMLILRDGSRLQVGESAADTAVKLKNWQTGDDAVERGEHGDRITRSYDDGIRRFLLVIESDQGVEPRVAAIYLPGHAAGPR